jgi:glycosyltransferase involved in cell wall biosynthesis
MPAGISVIVCCYNSVPRIEPTLKHLAVQQNLPLTQWEVIVVDNASTDNTAEKATQTWSGIDGSKPSFKVIFEKTAGLSAARKKGIAESKYDYVLFCDDDNWLDKNYLSTALNILQENPLIGALGGTGHPVFEGEEPPYFWINQFHTLAVGEQASVDGDITDIRGVLYGAGMIVNKVAFRKLMEQYAFQFQVTDRIGNLLVSSGDHELCLALKKIGYRIYSSRLLKFQHYIPKHRTSIAYYKRLYRGFGNAYALLQVYRINDENISDVKNDYRYICLRSLMQMIVAQVKLIINGFYVRENKYKFLDQVQVFYINLGIFETTFKVKNAFRLQYFALPLFTKTY